LVSWLFCWLFDWLVVCLVGWLATCLVSCNSDMNCLKTNDKSMYKQLYYVKTFNVLTPNTEACLCSHCRSGKQ
jgi:hypothetical protein